MTERDILNLIENDPWMMNILNIAENQCLCDWAIGAGFIRNKVWNHLHGYIRETVDTADIDLVYFDAKNLDWESDNALSEKLTQATNIVWQIRNQAYMHERNNLPPYKSTQDAISQWPETATAIGIKRHNGELELIAPHGISDLVCLIIRPTPSFNDLEQVKHRAMKKQWLEKWPKLIIEGL